MMAKQATTYQQRAYEFVRSSILDLTYKPGEYLSDSQIASELKISRTPVREAFRRLENEGFLINEARRGWRVYTLSLNDIHDIFDLKVAIEGMLARKAAGCGDESLRNELQRAMDEMKAAAERGDSDAWFQADRELHDILYQMADNDRAQTVVNTLNAQWHRVRVGFSAMEGRIQRSVPEHQAFVASVLAGDGDEAEAQMRRHLNQVREELVRLLVNMVLPFAQNGI